MCVSLPAGQTTLPAREASRRWPISNGLVPSGFPLAPTRCQRPSSLHNASLIRHSPFMPSRLKHIQNWPEVAKENGWLATGLVQRCGVSVRTLERHFLAHLDQTPKEWLLGQRQLFAFELLTDGTTVKEVAHRLQYKHASHLTNRFKRHWGRPPTREMKPIERKYV